MALGVAAEIQLHRSIGARDLPAFHSQIAHPRIRGDEPCDVTRVGQRAAGLVAVEAPQANELPYRGIEKVSRLRLEDLRLSYQRGDFRRGADRGLAARDR